MTAEVRLAEYGLTFATRQRADEIAAGVPAAAAIALDFEGVLASTSGFLDGLIGALAERDADVGLTGMTPPIEQIAARIVERRGLGSRFRFLSAA